MLISEIFRSIQGEGIPVGVPTTFVRLAGCNLRCKWCDTPYAQEAGDGKEMTIKDVISEVESLGMSYVCITGGEPLLQKGDVYKLIDSLVAKGFVIALETNGAVDIKDTPIEDNLMVSMDIKLPSSGMQDKMIAENISFLGPTDQLKFPVKDRTDYDEAKRIILEHNPRCNIIIQPIWGADYTQIAQWVIDDKMEFRVLPQIHKFIWGEERGR